ncbi:MAG TPA: hypothetical protein VMQ99_09725 [Acetobacteraceae bacterium]|nr:hypothetical protein [Acetobacteraceae bacterium]
MASHTPIGWIVMILVTGKSGMLILVACATHGSINGIATPAQLNAA